MNCCEDPGKLEIQPTEDPFVVDCQGKIGYEVEEDPSTNGKLTRP